MDVAVSGLMYDSRVGSDDARVGVGDEDAAELVVVAHEHAVEEFLGASEGVVHGARVAKLSNKINNLHCTVKVMHTA